MNPPTTKSASNTKQRTSLADPLPGGHPMGAIHIGPAAGDLLPTDQASPDTQATCVGGQLLPGDQSITDSQTRCVAGDLLATDHLRLDIHRRAVGGVPLLDDQCSSGAQSTCVVEQPSPVAAKVLPTSRVGAPLPDTFSTTTITRATPITGPSLSSSSPADQEPFVTHWGSVGGNCLPQATHRATSKGASPGALSTTDQTHAVTHVGYVGGPSVPTDQGTPDTQRRSVGGPPFEPPVPPKIGASTSDQPAGGWLELRIWAEMLHDAQLARIAACNRAERGGVDPALYEAHVRQLESVEHACALAMRRCFRRVVPAELVGWQKEQKGIGEHLIARLLGHLGDPLIATPHEWMTTPPEGHVCDAARCGDKRHLVGLEPYQRSVGQLWAYCGHGDPERKKHKGMTADDALGLGSPGCKMLVHLLAEACMKQKPGNRYRDVYENRRFITVERTHATVCVRCGPSGKPAAEGSPWSKAHQHADALRVVGKEMLRDMWRARHAASHAVDATHSLTAGGELLEEAS